MAEQAYYMRCPICGGSGLDSDDCSPCFECRPVRVVPLSSSVLVIEDFDAAVSRVRKWLAVRNGEVTMLEVPSLLRAAVGEGDR